MAGAPGGQVIRVTIFNQNYSLLASDEPGRVEELALWVDEIMHGISDEAGTIDPARVAVLASLHLADQLRTLQGEVDRLRSTFENRARQFTIRIDQALEA
ncbi:MAG TPA: cell division protein ZapA [Bryobacteraceae bacterium]|nr:cell division protein ZapA [Bryobacteraceae bacterium]